MTALDDKMAELGRRFAARAGEELAALDAALAADDRQAVIERAHKLAGVSAMFGFGAIGEAAAALEHAALAGDHLRAPAEPLRGLLAALASST